MRALDIIIKKRNGEALTQEELRFMISGYVSGQIPEYQISSWLMATYFSGMNKQEAAWLTREMIDSGETIDLAGLAGPLVDKHSTGGVGDKVSLILAPVAAACGLQVPMMSGRALGHTGGTLDKLESIPGYTTAITQKQFRDIIGEVGYAMTGQSEKIVPADRKLYSLRDVTGTVESVPLITTSILSKKFAEGAHSLVFDVKTGRGAFMKTLEAARELASYLVETGQSLGRQVIAVMTNMDNPLGYMIGNFLEVEESARCLQGETSNGRLTEDPRSQDLMAVTIRLTAWMLVAGGKAKDVQEGEEKCREAIASGEAWKRFVANLKAQGGDVDDLLGKVGKWRAEHSAQITAPADGVLTEIDAYRLGMTAVYLGVGRSKADDEVLPHVGVELAKKPGESVAKGETLCTLYGTSEEAVTEYSNYGVPAFTVDPDAKPGSTSEMILEEIAQ
jgi:pyrimidine-nucleoside phosphorylase